jgi:hypothetical protein
MKPLETNVFPLRNLDSLSLRYRFHRIRGLDRALEAEFTNRSQLRGLARRLHCPVTVVDRQGEPLLVLPEDRDPPSEVRLVGTVATFEPREAFDLDFAKPSTETLDVVLNVLRFHVEGPLRDLLHLWQPRSGDAFLRRRPQGQAKGICHYEGFRVRPVYLEESGFGLCVDLTSRFVYANPIPAKVSRDAFQRWRNRHAIYRYGDNWFEVRLVALADQGADEFWIDANGKRQLLLDYIIDDIRKPIPPEVQDVPADGSVAFYLNGRGEQRAAPTALCYPVVDTEESGALGLHRRSIVGPKVRHAAIRRFVREELSRLEIAGIELGVQVKPVSVSMHSFLAPDLRFGCDQILSVRETPGARRVTLDRLGRARLDALQDPKAGFLDRRPLDRQYLVLPKSIWEGPGRDFVTSLQREVDALFPQEGGYEPTVVAYDDSGRRNVARQGAAILDAIQQQCPEPGYAVVMVHRVGRADDELAAFVCREAGRQRDVRAAIIHSETIKGAYTSELDRSGNRRYCVRREERGRLGGYVRNVALSKVLLANSRWPFALAARLHADVVIGLDVKHHTCGLLAINSTGDRVVDWIETSNQKERLREDQSAVLVERVLRRIAAYQPGARHIALQRDGRSWATEGRGAKRAIARLKTEGLLPEDAALTIVEVLKTSRAPMRFFDVSRRGADHEWIENPEVGSTFFADGQEAYICTTGRAFPRPGTSRPLHIRRVEGPLDLRMCSEDVYALSCLTWSRPDDCSRYPITIRLLDRLLEMTGGEYDADDFRYSDYSAEES